ncbi:MAG TPA: S8 family serine peptidase [Thermoanaerobaculia bacterium]
MRRLLLLFAVAVAVPVFAADRVIVEFREAPLALRRGVAAASYQDSFARFRRDLAGSAQGKKAAAKITREYYRAFHGVALEAAPEVVAEIRRLPYVRAVSPDLQVEAHAEGVDGVGIVGARRLWETRGARGAGMVIAILDSGIDYRHPALGGGFGPGHKVAGGWDFVNDDGDPLDDHYHGTHVAGIAAAKSPELMGVAPEATLLAFKVLDFFGRGWESSVLAAIERTLDPNGDGNFDDRVDVANLSLGMAGHADDALSRAVDAATAAGVVFTVSAGNGRTFMAIASPGVARSAITVGSTLGADAMALTSSRGPSIRGLALKPEVLAPGENINSTMPDHAYGPLSGTSMAAPHVAGLAALLRELHPEWTPAEVKSALTNNATAIAAETIEQGGGLVDGPAAASVALFASPAVISFGRGDLLAAAWTRSQDVTLTNRGATERTFTAIAHGTPAGVTVTVEPAAFTLAAGASQQVRVTVGVTNATSTTTTSLTLGGTIRISDGAATTVVPWAAVKAARATVTYTIGFPSVAFMNDQGWTGYYGWFDPVTLDVLLPAGRYDFVLASIEPDDPGSPVGDQLRVFIQDQVRVEGEHTFAFDAFSELLRLRLDGRASSGERLIDRALEAGVEESTYLSEVRIQRAGGSDVFAPFAPLGKFTEIEISAASPRWNIHAVQSYVDRARNEVYLIAHDPVNGVTESRTLTRAGSELAAFDLRFPAPEGAPMEELLVLPYSAVGKESTRFGAVADAPDADGGWRGRLFLTEAAAEVLAGVLFQAQSAEQQLLVWPLHLRGGRAVSSFERDPGPAAYGAAPGETLFFTEAAYFPRMSLQLQPGGSFSLLGRLHGRFGEEWLSPGFYGATLEFRNSSRTIASGPFDDVALAMRAEEPDAYSVDLVVHEGALGGARRSGTLHQEVDTRRSDTQPPMLTAFRIVDGSGRATESLPLRAAPEVIFSAADFNYTAWNVFTYHRVRPEATKVAWRVHGSAAWQSVTPLLLGEHAPEYGHLFRAGLAAATGAVGMIDVRVQVTDEAGNSTAWTLAPAFSVGLDHRRRPVR